MTHKKKIARARPLRVVLFAVFVAAQSTTVCFTQGTENISGIVSAHPRGNPLRGVVVEIAHPKLATITDSLGRFQFGKLPRAAYILRFTHDGYVPMVFRSVPVDSDRRLPLLVNMSRTPVTQDGIKIYVPDSTIDYKIRILDPTKKQKK